MNSDNDSHFKVIIMGAGVAGISACYHLLIKMPELAGKIAIIDPRTMERNNVEEDYKVGESTVEVAALFFSKELGLQDYLLENHALKYTLQYHWPKKLDTTSSMHDFYSLYAIKNPSIQSFQLNRSKLERDMLKMVIERGGVYYHGKVINVDLTPGDEIKTVDIQLLSTEKYFNDQKPLNTISITGDYLVDASGRNFIIGSKTNNIIKDPKDIEGLENGSSWFRVINTKGSIYDVDEIQKINTTGSIKYCTDHFHGQNFWIWKIPIETTSNDYSIGISYDRNFIPPTSLNSLDKVKSFLKSNCKIVYDIVESGEVVDFHRWPKIAHKAKTIFSQDNWCVIGDSAAVFDPFYSTGMVMMAFTVEMATKLLQFKFSGNQIEYKKRVDIYNQGSKTIIDYNNHLVRDLHSQSGNASTMSWRIYYEVTSYFGITLPMYLGKYFLCPDFLHAFIEDKQNRLSCHQELIYLVKVANDKQLNIGFMDCHLNSDLTSNFSPIASWDYDNIVTGAKYGYKQLNIFKHFQWTSYYQALIVSKLYYKVYGISTLFNLNFYKSIGDYSKKFITNFSFSLLHSWGQRNKPYNQFFANMRNDFKSYKYEDRILDWNY